MIVKKLEKYEKTNQKTIEKINKKISKKENDKICSISILDSNIVPEKKTIKKDDKSIELKNKKPRKSLKPRFPRSKPLE